MSMDKHGKELQKILGVRVEQDKHVLALASVEHENGTWDWTLWDRTIHVAQGGRPGDEGTGELIDESHEGYPTEEAALQAGEQYTMQYIESQSKEGDSGMVKMNMSDFASEDQLSTVLRDLLGTSGPDVSAVIKRREQQMEVAHASSHVLDGMVSMAVAQIHLTLTYTNSAAWPVWGDKEYREAVAEEGSLEWRLRHAFELLTGQEWRPGLIEERAMEFLQNYRDPKDDLPA